MELPNIGKQCLQPNCKQLDFLPLVCKCGLVFCSEHFSKHAETCPEVQKHNEPKLEVEQDMYVCSHLGCGSKSYVPLLCEKCKKHFCVSHRHIECEEKDPVAVAAQLEKFIAPLKSFSEAKSAVDKQLDASLNQARKKTKTQQMANKVQLMRIKNKATGLKNVPAVDRVYFNVQHPKNIGKTSPVFVSKTWSLGRAIDAISEELKVVNQNHLGNSPKLRLFHEAEKIVSTDLTKKIEQLLSEGELMDGQDVLLEYVDCNSEQ